MRFSIIFIAILLVQSCQPKKVYNDEAFNAISKKNQTINPYGTYTLKGTFKTLSSAVLTLDTNQANVTFLDSTEKEISYKSNWILNGFDTQYFNLPYPFEKGLFLANGLFLLDSLENVFVKKTADSIAPILPKDPLLKNSIKTQD